MRLSIDGERCQGHGKCYLVAPEAFEPAPDDDWGRATVLIPEPDAGDAALLQRLGNARDSCPEQAITLTDSPAEQEHT